MSDQALVETSASRADGVWLLADIRSVQRYIFETDVLAQMRGASILIANFDSKVKVIALNYRGDVQIGLGGTYRLRFENETDAKKAERALRGCFEQEVGLPISRFTSIVVDASDDRSNAYTQLAEARGSNDELPSNPGGLVERCGICRRRPAAKVVRLPGEETALGCEVCAMRQIAATTDDSGSPVTRNLSEFASSGTPSGYIAVIVADGDGIGQLMMHAEDDAELSVSLQTATKGAVNDASKAADDALIKQWVGGDDAVLVTHPQHAIQVATKLVRSFNESLAGEGHSVTMSCAVVVAHASMPFSNLLALAEELLGESKEARRGNGAFAGAGMVAIESTAASSASGVSAVRGSTREPFEVSGRGSECLLDHLDVVIRTLVEQRASRALIRSLASFNGDGDAVDSCIEQSRPDLLAELDALEKPWQTVRQEADRLVQIHKLLLG